jgi:hypothetical protein
MRPRFLTQIAKLDLETAKHLLLCENRKNKPNPPVPKRNPVVFLCRWEGEKLPRHFRDGGV